MHFALLIEQHDESIRRVAPYKNSEQSLIAILEEVSGSSKNSLPIKPYRWHPYSQRPNYKLIFKFFSDVKMLYLNCYSYYRS